MGAAQIREELHQYIDKADERILNMIYAMVKADTGQEDYLLTDEHKQLLDERLAAHKASPQEGSTWSEVKNRVTQKT